MDESRDGRQLYCVVKDESGNSVQSDTVTISLQKAELKITKQPEDAMALDGELVHVTVEAEGEHLTYEWWYATPGSTKFYKSSITTATYSTRMDTSRDGRQLYCIVKDENGNSVQSNTVTISLRPAILITSQPEDAMAPDGELVHVTVEAEGENLTYEWWYALAGSTKFYKSSITTATYSTRMDATRDGRQLYCVVKDESGNSVQSDTVTISLQKAELKITKQPEDAMALDGELVHVTVEAEGENLTYEWWYATPGSTKFYKSSITTATYSTRMDATRDGRQLYCVVKDESGNSVQSNTVTISLRPAILITSQPEDAMAPDGELVRVTVEAEGEGLTYEWWYALAGSTKFYKSSITTATYTTRMDATRDGCQLYCIVKDENGNSVQSDTVTLFLDLGYEYEPIEGDDGVIITGYTGEKTTTLDIPARLGGHIVRGIGAGGVQFPEGHDWRYGTGWCDFHRRQRF